MAVYTFKFLKSGAKRSSVVNVSATTATAAMVEAKKCVAPGTKVELLRRVANSAFTGKISSHYVPTEGKYKVTIKVWDERDLVTVLTDVVMAKSEDDAIQSTDRWDNWREDHEETIYSHCTYSAVKVD